MQYLKRWQSYLTITIVISLALIYTVLYKDALAQPNDLWSKELTIDKISNIEDPDPYYTCYFDIISDDEAFYYAEIMNNQLTVREYNDHLSLIKTYRSSVDIDAIINITLQHSESGYKIFAATESQLLLLETDSTLNNISISVLATDFDNIVFFDQNAVYAKDNGYTLINENINYPLFENTDIESYDFTLSEDSLYLNAITYDKGIYYADIYDFSLISGNYNSIYHERLTGQNSTIPLESQIIVDDDYVYTQFSLKNTKYGQNYNYFFKLDRISYKLIDSSNFENTSYHPNFQFVDYYDNISLIYNDASFIGKTDLSSQDKTFTNIHLSETYDANTIILSNSPETENNTHFLTNNNKYYIFSNVYSNHENALRVSSTSTDLIKQSKTLDFKNYLQIFLNSLTYIPASIMALFVPLIMMIFPVIIIVIPIAIFKISWAEKNQIKMLKISVMIYLLSKVYYLINNRSALIINGIGVGAEPWHLSNILFLFITGIFTSLISIFCLNDYYSHHKDVFFINHFIFYYGIEMILFLFYFIIYKIMFL